MSNNNTTGYGTEVAANVTMQPNGEHTLASVEWQCDFWTTGRRFRVTKDKAFQDGENSYICYVDSTKTGRGALWGQLYVRIPDSQAADGFREEVSVPFPIMAADGSDKQLYIV
jgi:hypothetical protein